MDVALLESINNAPDEIWLLARIVLIATLTWITLRLTRRVMRQLIDRKLLTGSGEIAFRGISRVIVLLIAGLFMLEQLGVSTGTVWAAVSAVLVMIAVGFVAVWSVLSNALCSMLLLIYAPFRVGDEVELVDPANGFKLAGRVIDLNMLFVTLRETITSADGEREDVTLRLPNNLFFQRGIRSRPGRATVPLSDAHGLTTVAAKKSV